MKVPRMDMSRMVQLPALACLLSVCPAAQSSVDLVLKMDASWGHNSNLFRSDATSLGDTANPNTPLATVATPTATQTLGAALTVGIPMGSPQTRLVLSTTLAPQHYGAVHALNHTAQAHSLRLPWRYADLWEGELSAGTNVTAYPVDDFYTELDTVNRRWVHATVHLKPTPDLAFPLQITNSSSRHADTAVHGQLDEDINSVSASALYRSPLGNTAQIGVVTRQIVFPNRISRGATSSREEREQDTFVELLWLQSPQTQLSFRWATRVKSTPDGQFPDSRQNIFRWAASHALSPYTRLEAQAWRQPYQNTDARANYGISKGHGLGVIWTPSHRVNVRAGWQKEAQQDLTLFSAAAGLALNPVVSRPSVRGEYLLDRGWTAFVDAARETRVRREQYTARQTVWRVGVEYRYENLPGATQRSQPAALPGP